MPQSEVPTREVLELRSRGKENADIILDLQRRGYTFQQISEALTQASVKQSVEGSQRSSSPGPLVRGLQKSVMEDEGSDEPPKPSMQSTQEVLSSPVSVEQESMESFAPQQYPSLPRSEVSFSSRGSEDFEEIAESIIDEKWRKLVEDFGDLGVWKEKVHDEIGAIKQELMRMQTRFDGLQHAVMGKVKEYDESISDVGVELKALEKLLQNLMNPLTNNIKELKSLTEKLKKS